MKTHVEALRKLALGYPETSEGIACEGTAVEKRTVKVRDKAFLFLGPTEAMVKLAASLPEATGLAKKAPELCRVGAHGWATVSVREDATPLDVLTRWVDESYRLVAPRALVAGLPARGETADAASTKKRGKGNSRRR